MNKEETKEHIVEKGLEYARQEGLCNLTIRKMASLIDSSVGTIYNYFDNKDQLVDEIIESYWENSLDSQMDKIMAESEDYVDGLCRIYRYLKSRSEEFHKMFILSNESSLRRAQKGHSKKGVYYLKAMEKFNQLLDLYPEEKSKVEKIGSVDEFNSFVIDNMASGIKRDKSQLVFFKASVLEILK